MGGVKAKSIHMVLFEKELTGINEHVLHIGSLRRYAVSPRRLCVAKIQTTLGRVYLFVGMLQDHLPQRINLIRSVIKDLVKQNGQPPPVSRIHQLAQIVWGAEIPPDHEEERGIVTT